MLPKRSRGTQPASSVRAPRRRSKLQARSKVEARGKAEDSVALGIALQNPRGYRDVGQKPLEAWLKKLVTALAPRAGSLAARLTSDAEVRRLNRRFRAKDKPTDVLSFPGETTADGYHLGDIVISVPTARRQADDAGHSLARELRTLLLHGVLHCLGYDHESDGGAGGTMERRERRLRRVWIGDA